MTIANLEKIKCPNGHIFEAQLISAISVSDNFELKEALIAGELNLVTCPECGQMFYAECFILYHDSQNELISFVYPLIFQEQAIQCMAKMQKEFKLALKNFSDKDKITYEPILLFGIENLVLLLREEQDIEDEEAILKHLANDLNLTVVKIVPSIARKLAIPKFMPFDKKNKDFSEKSLFLGLDNFVKHNSNLEHYADFFKRISKNKSMFTEISKALK
ncbi:MAG: hypothetical protein LBI80_04540 [Endomicrobium sp.]|jgi:hypothetical protein|nr:hypothetical protein [Endomicrobium sp.]